MSGADLTLLVRFEDETMTGLSPLTRHTRQGTALRFAKWLEPRSLLDATTGDIAAWLDELGVSAKTRGDRVGQLHQFYNWALNENLVGRDPAAPLARQRRPINAGDFPDIARGWWIAQERKALAPTTIKSRACCLRLFFDWLAPKALVDATEPDVEAWLDSRKMAPKARYRAISDLHMFYRWAKTQGIVGEDPTENIDRPRLRQMVPRPIPGPDLEKAVERADPTVRAMLHLAALNGLRAKEIAGLRRCDLLEHLDPPMLIVSAPKGRRERSLPLHPTVWESLRQAGMPRSGYLFAYPNGRQWPAWKVSGEVNTHLASLGIPATLHQCRHYFGTEVYAASLDLRLTQELLGHSSPTTTAGYVQFSRSRATEIVGALNITPSSRS